MTGAIDIGGTNIAVGLVDGEGRVHARRECPTDARRGYPDALGRIISMLRLAIEEAGPIHGIGIGSTGPVDPLAGVIGKLAFLPGWEGAPLAGDLARAFEVRVAMENDGDAAALGEAAWGAARNCNHLIFVTIGTGIGGGILLDGRLYRGAGGAHPEIGHHVIDPAGPLCSCGARGCWESLASGPAMAAWLGSGFTAQRICELARQGDGAARQAVDREAAYLGLALANLVTLLVPEMIVLGGGLMRSADLFLDAMRETIRRHCGYVPFERTALRISALGPDAALAGAAAVWNHRFMPEAWRG
jgi:glucokinase